MGILTKKQKIEKLEKKLRTYEGKLAKKRLGYGQAGRTGSGDSYSDQLRDDTNVLEGIIISIKKEIESLKDEE
jgi:hypothetical protein